MDKKFSIMFFLVFLGALILRCFLINWTLQYGNNGDLTRYEDWARVAHTYGAADTYLGKHTSIVVNNEPPGTLYILSAAYETYILEGRLIAKITHTAPGSLLWVNTYLQHITMKIPSLLSDIGIGFLIFLIVKKFANKKKALFAAALFLFNPIVWYNSAIWGQMDGINNFFFISSLFFAFRKNIFLSILTYVVSIYIKVSLLPLLPFYLIFMYFISGKKLMKVFSSLLLSLVIITLVTFPISSNPVSWLFIHIPQLSLGELQNIVSAAFNFWMMVTCLPVMCPAGSTPLITEKFLGITLNIWGYILFGCLTIPLLVLHVKKYKQLIKPENIFLLLSLVALLTFLFLPKMHDRYMYPMFPLLAVVIGLSKQYKWYVIVYVVLSLLHFDNLVYSWFPVVFDSTTTFYHIFYGSWLRWILSITTVIMGVWFYALSIKRFVSISKKP